MPHADMELVCSGQSFPCHKFVMGARSDVFRAMFSHDMKENQDGRVEVRFLQASSARPHMDFFAEKGIKLLNRCQHHCKVENKGIELSALFRFFFLLDAPVTH